MAFLGFGKKEEEAKKEVKKPEVLKVAKKAEPKEVKISPPIKGLKSDPTEYSSVLIRPRITEKSAIVAEEGGVYTFDVDPRSTKQEIQKAVEQTYKVKPVKINVSVLRQKMVVSRGKVGFKSGGKKAMVYLKKGDKIEFV